LIFISSLLSPVPGGGAAEEKVGRISGEAIEKPVEVVRILPDPPQGFIHVA
jgi:hypothetical protein